MSSRILIGGSGLLGQCLIKGLDRSPELLQVPTRQILDITKTETAKKYFLEHYHKDRVLNEIILAAAFTDTVLANTQRQTVYDTNIEGPMKLIGVLNQLMSKEDWQNHWPRLIYISSDYVFNGESGMYKTTDPTCPVSNNYYAYSKAVAEEIVKMYPNHLIIRTSFVRDDYWPHKNAFIDKFTSADKVGIIAPLIARHITKYPYRTGIIHVGTERKSVLELARSIDSAVGSCSRLNVTGITLPYDTSLELTSL